MKLYTCYLLSIHMEDKEAKVVQYLKLILN